MVTFSSPGEPESYPSYYRTRRTPFVGLQDQEVVRYDSEVVPMYSDHDARIRGYQSGGQLAIEQARAQSSMGDTFIERSPSGLKEAQGTTYVIEEHIPAQLHRPTRRTPFEGLHSTDSTEYHSEVVPAYSDHDVMIRGAQSIGQSYTDNALVERSSRRRDLQSSDERALSRRSSSCQRDIQRSTSQALVKRSSSCSREVQSSGTQRANVQEYIKNGRDTREYVLEEHIPAEYNYRTPTKSEKLALDCDRQALSVVPKRESPAQMITILAEPGLLYYVPLRSDDPKPWPELEHKPSYYDTRKAVFTEPQGSDLKHYTFSIMPSDPNTARQMRSSSCDNALERSRISRSHRREDGLKQQVIYEDIASDNVQNNMTTTRNASTDMALVPFERSQSVPPAQQDYSSQWIKIPRGPATITVFPAISSSDPSTWATQDPLQVQHMHDTHKDVDSRAAHDHAVAKDYSQSKKQPAMEIVTYKHFPKQDTSLEKRKIIADQRYDRSHKDNRGSEYRSKWVSFKRGPSPFVYSSIHSLDQEACSNPALTGYLGNSKYLEERERLKIRDENKYSQTKFSSIDNNYKTKNVSSKVNRILNTREDMEKKHLLDMLFDIQHILKERQALGEYEVPLRMKNKLNFLTSTVQDISLKNKCRHDPGHYNSKDSAKSFLGVSCLLAPLRPDIRGTNAISRYRYMLHEPRVL